MEASFSYECLSRKKAGGIQARAMLDDAKIVRYVSHARWFHHSKATNVFQVSSINLILGKGMGYGRAHSQHSPIRKAKLPQPLPWLFLLRSIG